MRRARQLRIEWWRHLLPKIGHCRSLKRKYRERKSAKRQGRGNISGNSGVSAGKHTAHPDVHGYRRNGYRCEPKWNVVLRDDVS